MIKNSRSDEILSIVNASSRISVAELAEKNYSSASTILCPFSPYSNLKKNVGYRRPILVD